MATIRDIGVTVTQVLVDAAPAVAEPELLQVIVGINRQVIKDKLAGAYANLAGDILLSDLLATSELDETSVEVSVVNELGKFPVPLHASTVASLKEFKVNATETGTTFPAYLRVDRTSQAISTSGVVTVAEGTNRQTLASAVVTVGPGTQVNITGGSFIVNGVVAGDLLELNDDNNSDVLRRFRILTIVDLDSVTVESLNPDSIGALAGATHTNVRIFPPTYTLTDANAAYLANRTRPVDDALAPGSKLFPQPNDTLSNQATFDGLFAFADYKPTTGTAQRWKILTWNSETSVVLEPLAGGTSPGPIWVAPPLTTASSVRYEVVTEEPAIGRIPGASADVYQTYTALRKDLLGVPTLVQGVIEAAAVFGAADADNPLGLAMSLATAINSTTQVMGVQVDEDDTDSHGVALNALGLRSEPYYLTPLSTKSEVVSLYVAHVVDMSQPEERKERVALFSLPIPTRTILKDFLLATPVVTVSGSLPNLNMNIPGAGFLTNGALPGHKVEFKDPTFTSILRTFTITHVVDENNVYIASSNPDSLGVFVNGAKAEVKVVTPSFTSDQKVTALSAAAQSFANRRIALIEPDSATLNVSNVDVTVDGSYPAVAVAALYSVNEPGTPLSRVAVPGIKSISGSDDVFTNTQLRALTSNGVMVLVQPSKLAPPVIRHEVSTDVSSAFAQQFSSTPLVDSLAKTFRVTIDPLMGRARMTDEFLWKIYIAVFAVLDRFKGQRRISNFEILEIGESTTDDTAVAARISITVPNVANNLDITLLV